MSHFKCSLCGKEYELDPFLYLCPDCSANQGREPLRGILYVIPDEERFDLFRKKKDPYLLLPVEPQFLPSIPVGNTPLWRSGTLARETGHKNIYIKNDALNPTYSLKDRASFLVAGVAKKYGINRVVLASTGNAASSMAGIGAASDLDVVVFIPEGAPEEKLVQCIQYGAEVVKVKGDYDIAFDEAWEFAERTESLNRNTGLNPFTIDGKKTVSLEIFLQMNLVPDYVFVPVGDGVIISGVYRGFEDIKHSGLSEKMPVIVGVQAEGSDGVCRIFETGRFEYRTPETVADLISVGIPRAGYVAANFLKKYEGMCVRVNDDEILAAQRMLSQRAGVFAEPSGAASLAGFLKIKENIPQEKNIVLLITGSGLKDVKSAMEGMRI